jgi:hypothetical protein
MWVPLSAHESEDISNSANTTNRDAIVVMKSSPFGRGIAPNVSQNHAAPAAWSVNGIRRALSELYNLIPAFQLPIQMCERRGFAC